MWGQVGCLAVWLAPCSLSWYQLAFRWTVVCAWQRRAQGQGDHHGGEDRESCKGWSECTGSYQLWGEEVWQDSSRETQACTHKVQLHDEQAQQDTQPGRGCYAWAKEKAEGDRVLRNEGWSSKVQGHEGQGDGWDGGPEGAKGGGPWGLCWQAWCAAEGCSRTSRSTSWSTSKVQRCTTSKARKMWWRWASQMCSRIFLPYLNNTHNVPNNTCKVLVS